MTLGIYVELTEAEARELSRIAWGSLPPSDDLRVTPFYDERVSYSALKKLIAKLPPREEEA